MVRRPVGEGFDGVHRRGRGGEPGGGKRDGRGNLAAVDGGRYGLRPVSRPVLPTTTPAPMISLEGKTGLVFGIANDRSIAAAIAQQCHDAGATMAFTHLPDADPDRPKARNRCLKVVGDWKPEPRAALRRRATTPNSTRSSTR